MKASHNFGTKLLRPVIRLIRRSGFFFELWYNVYMRNNLSQKQKQFCRLYVSKEFFGNGVQAYMEAYNTQNNNSARVNAHKLLTNANILKHVNQLLSSCPMQDCLTRT